MACAFGCCLAGGGCGRPAEAPAPGTATPVYDKQTGKLEQLVSDRDGDGKVDTRAFMTGTRVERIEIDRNGDGLPDRVERYALPADAGSASVITEAVETAAPGGPVIRRESFDRGVVARVEEDTDGDGRMDKWERYIDGRLAVLELDLKGSGRPTQRLTYTPTGVLERVESDPDGDGTFEGVPSGAGSRAGARP